MATYHPGVAVPDPAQQQPPPPEQAQTPVAPFAVAAAPFVAGSVAPAVAGVAARALTGAALKTAVQALIEGFGELAERRWSSGHDFTREELARVYPDRKPSELAKLLAQEEKFEKEFRRKMATRLGVDLQEALSVPDQQERLARLKAIFDREKRYSVLREEAMFLRALGKADAMQLREASPQGAYWKLSSFVKEHTLDCLAMGEKFWPWEVLEAFQPPVHHGCACWLLGLDEAVADGLMTPDQIPDTGDAIFRAKQAQKLAEQLEETLDPLVIREYIEEPARAAGNVLALRRPIDTGLILQEAAKHSGAMVALYPPRTLAKALAVDGGEPVEDMHVTLAFLGEAKDLKNVAALTKAVEGFAATCPPITGEVSGSGTFTGGPDPVTYASVDLPGLPSQRERLVETLKGAGSPALNNHGFTPHMTLAYDDVDVDVKARPVTFSTISLVLGGKRLDFRLGGTALQEANEQMRYPKGYEHGGEFRPKVASLRRLIPHPRSPLATRAEKRGRWSWINGVYTRIPEADHWEKHVAGHVYMSPAGSTNVYKDGKHFDGMGRVSPEKRTGLRTRKPATPEVIQKAADAARAELRAPRVVSPAMPPVQVGDAPSRLHALKGQGWKVAGVVGKALKWHHPSGAKLETEFDGKRVSKVDYDPAGPPAEVGKELGRPPRDFEEFRADASAWGHEIADRHGASIKLGDIVIDPSLDDHAGQHLWSGRTMLGPDTEKSINDAGAARAQGRKLSDAQKRGVWGSYWNAAHELSHAVNPISPHSFLAEDGVDANLEEALGEELAHVHATERLQEQGQTDVLRWREAHPNSPSVVGVYTRERFALGSLLDEAGLTDDFDRRVFLEDLKYRVAPDDRAGAIADAISAHGDPSSRDELIQHVRDVMTSDRGFGAALPLAAVSPGKAQVGDAYGRFAGAELSTDGNTLTLADGSRRTIERLAVPGGNPRLAAVTDGSAIVAYGPGQASTPGMTYADGKPKTFRFLDSAERGRMILRGLTGQGSPGTDFGLRDIYEPGDTAEDIARKLEGQKSWVAVNTVPVKRRFDGTYGVGHADYDGRKLSGLGSAKTAAETALLRGPKTTAGPMSPGVSHLKAGDMVRNARFGTVAEVLEPQQGDKIRVRWLGTGVETTVPARLLEPFDQADPAGAENEDAWVQHLLSQGQGELPPGEQQALFAAGKKTTKKSWDPLDGLKIGGDESAPEATGAIPVYDRTPLTLRDRAGGSNGARWAEDDDQQRWLIKAYQGDQDRVATEVLANSVYRALGAKVPVAGTINMPPPKPDFKTVPDRDLGEPPLPKKEKGRNVSTGMVVMDHGKVVLIRPKGGFGGYDYTIPKGRKEWGLTGQQNAAKEVWEETGLHATPVAYLGDYEGDTGVTRIYMGVRTGGEPHPDDPTPHVKGSGKESESVHIVSFEEAADMLNRDRDQTILDDAFDHHADLPTEVPDQFPHPKIKPAVAYPALAGQVHNNFPPSEALGEHYMADALLANWDFVGLTGDNVIWDENKTPIRLDQGGTFEFRAQGDPKPYGPIPTEVWTMLSKGQGARGVVVSEDQMRDQARAISKRLTPDRIDKLVDAAPFVDNAMRERVRENLKARVGWMDQFGQGHVDLPKPAEGDEAHDALFDAQRDLMLFPEQEDALMKFLSGGAPLVQNALHNPKDKRPKSVQRAIDELDSLMRHAKTEEDVIAWLPVNTSKPDNLVNKTITSKKFIGMDLERPDAPVVARVVVPGRSLAVYTGLWEGLAEGTPDLLVSRDAKIKVSGYEDGVLQATLKTQTPWKTWKPQKWVTPKKDEKGPMSPGTGPDYQEIAVGDQSKAAPLYDLSLPGGHGASVYDPATQAAEEPGIDTTERWEQIRRARGKPDEPVTIYRAVPKGVDAINPGDYVTISRAEAENFVAMMPDAHVISQVVPARHVRALDYLHEFSYFPVDTA